MVESNITLSSIPVKDYIGFQQDAALMKLISNERLFFADKIKKTNMYEWTQERTLVITDENIYNIHKKEIKRQIQIKDVSALIKTVSPSKCTTEFTIQVQVSYDYRLISSRREEVLDVIKRLYIVKLGRNMPIYHVTCKDLKDYTTTEKDMKKGENRYPQNEVRVYIEDLMNAGKMTLQSQNSTVSVNDDTLDDYEKAQQLRKQ